MLTTGNALALRVSLVYGWHRVGLRPNFFTLCAQRLSAGQPVAVPNDHWNSPVLVDDVAAWTTALLDSEHTGIVPSGGRGGSPGSPGHGISPKPTTSTRTWSDRRPGTAPPMPAGPATLACTASAPGTAPN